MLHSRWAWCLVAGGLLLPVLSHQGYAPVSLEYLAIAVAAALLGLACHWLARRSGEGAALLAVLGALVGLFYYGKTGSIPVVGPLIVPALAVGLYLWSKRDLSAVLRVMALVGGAQIASAAAMTPGTVTVLREAKLPLSDRPSVVHVLLDEAAGLASYPRDAVPEADLDRLAQAYISRGFTVFSRAYTADVKTRLSLTRILNQGNIEPETVLREVADPPGWHVHSAVGFDELAGEFAFDLTYTTYINLRAALRPWYRVLREAAYDGTIPADAVVRNGATLADRAWIAAATSWNWLRTADSPLFDFPAENTDLGKSIDSSLHPMWRTHPIVARGILMDLEQRLACCVGRGTYLFAHALLPHYPYAFDAKCALRPSDDWLNNTVHDHGEVDTLESRRERYRLQFAQTECAALHFGRIADVIAAGPATADAVVLVHGDHGSRITIENRKGVAPELYGQADYERDNRGTFLAIRMPGLAPGIIDTPVRVDDLYDALVRTKFRSLDVSALPRRADSPY